MGTQSHAWTSPPYHLTDDFALYIRSEVLYNKKLMVDHNHCISPATPLQCRGVGSEPRNSYTGHSVCLEKSSFVLA